MGEVTSDVARQLALRPGRSEPSLVEVTIRLVRAWLRTPPRAGHVSMEWLRAHEVESGKRGEP